jgi:antitoxin VapB
MHTNQRHHKRCASLFRNGRNQAIRLPVEFTLDADEVFIERQGEQLILTPKPKSWDSYFANSQRLSDDFPDDIEDLPPQDREIL